MVGNEPPFKIIASESCPPDTIFLVPTHPLTTEEETEVRELMKHGWNEVSAFCEVRARKSAAIKLAPGEDVASDADEANDG